MPRPRSTFSSAARPAARPSCRSTACGRAGPPTCPAGRRPGPGQRAGQISTAAIRPAVELALNHTLVVRRFADRPPPVGLAPAAPRWSRWTARSCGPAARSPAAARTRPKTAACCPGRGRCASCLRIEAGTVQVAAHEARVAAARRDQTAGTRSPRCAAGEAGGDCFRAEPRRRGAGPRRAGRRSRPADAGVSRRAAPQPCQGPRPGWIYESASSRSLSKS